MQITLKLKLPIRVTKNEGWFISCCPALNVHSQGRTRNRALKNLNDALKLFLICCYERGTLDKVLKESGFFPFEKGQKRAEPLPRYFQSMEVPLTLQFSKDPKRKRCPV
jgi:predicted RNase H-like HicB family nuclease